MVKSYPQTSNYEALVRGILTKDVFMHQPEGFNDASHPHHVYKLKKALYGLKQAPRVSYERAMGALLQWGLHTSKADTSLFI